MCVSVQSYRYVLINDVRTLELLNGCPITDAERANAFKKVCTLGVRPTCEPLVRPTRFRPASALMLPCRELL
jgi:hypothetical protein